MLRLLGGVRLVPVLPRIPADLSPRSCAATILMMLERLSAIGPMSREDEGVGYPALKAAAAHSIAMMLGARE